MNKLLFCTLLFGFSSASFAIGDRGLAKLISEDTGIDEEQIFIVLKSFKSVVSTQLKDGRTIRMQGFGMFELESTPARPGNPNTGEMRPIHAKNYLRFKPSKAGNQSVN